MQNPAAKESRRTDTADNTDTFGYIDAPEVRSNPIPPKVLMASEANTTASSHIPPLSTQQMEQHSSPLTLRADAELRSLLSTLPSKADLKEMVRRIEESHRKDILSVRAEVGGHK